MSYILGYGPGGYGPVGFKNKIVREHDRNCSCKR